MITEQRIAELFLEGIRNGSFNAKGALMVRCSPELYVKAVNLPSYDHAVEANRIGRYLIHFEVDTSLRPDDDLALKLLPRQKGSTGYRRIPAESPPRPEPSDPDPQPGGRP